MDIKKNKIKDIIDLIKKKNIYILVYLVNDEIYLSKFNFLYF